MAHSEKKQPLLLCSYFYENKTADSNGELIVQRESKSCQFTFAAAAAAAAAAFTTHELSYSYTAVAIYL